MARGRISKNQNQPNQGPIPAGTHWICNRFMRPLLLHDPFHELLRYVFFHPFIRILVINKLSFQFVKRWSPCPLSIWKFDCVFAGNIAELSGFKDAMKILGSKFVPLSPEPCLCLIENLFSINVATGTWNVDERGQISLTIPMNCCWFCLFSPLDKNLKWFLQESSWSSPDIRF